ncbi:hypothetical protein N9L68_03480 [bacterium]|nr:hypothetical protein [bacterium]
MDKPSPRHADAAQDNPWGYPHKVVPVRYNIYIYIYVFICMYIYIYVYIFIYICGALI